MKYDYVNVRNTPVEDCQDIIKQIGGDSRNYINSKLKVAAKRKLGALRRKANKEPGVAVQIEELRVRKEAFGQGYRDYINGVNSPPCGMPNIETKYWMKGFKRSEEDYFTGESNET